MSDLQTAFDLLHTIVGNGHRAQRHAPMTHTGSTSKYYIVHKPITNEQLRAHLLGVATYAIPLIGTDELVSAALIELDRDHLEGAKRIQRAAAARNVTILSIATHGAGNHDGSHNWAFFAERVNPAHARALMQQIADDAGYPDAETWPNGENIRLPFGRHRWTGDWGITLLPTGEFFDNNNPDERDAAVTAAAALPLNGVPPEPPKLQPKSAQSVQLSSQAYRRSAGRVSLDDVRARFNAEHTWSELLAAKGGAMTRDGWACNCGFKHSHSTQGAITSQDKIVTFSPNCTWAPHKDSGKALDKFGFYIYQWHGGNVEAALKTLNPIEPRCKKRQEPPLQEPERRAQTSEQAADAARKRKARRREAVETLADVQARASQDEELTKADRAVLEALIALANGRDWCRPSKPRLVEMSGYSLGTVKRSLMRLEARSYFVSQGKGGGSNQTAIRRFLRGSSAGEGGQTFLRGSSAVGAEPTSPLESPDEVDVWTVLRGSSEDTIECEMIHESHESCNLNHESQRACERAAPLTPDPPDLGELDSFDTWEEYDPPIGDAELAILAACHESFGTPDKPAMRESLLPDLLNEREPPPHTTPADRDDGPPTRWVKYLAGRWCAYDGQCWSWHATQRYAEAAAGLAALPQLTEAVPSAPGLLEALYHRLGRTADAERIRAARGPEPPMFAEDAASIKHSESLSLDIDRASEQTDDPIATYDEGDDWTKQEGPVPIRSWSAVLCPRELERWKRQPDLGGEWELRETSNDAEAKQLSLDAGDVPEATLPTMPSLLPQRENRMRRQTRSPAARQRYANVLATRNELELASELRKHRNTLKKYAGAAWLDQIHNKLVLVQAEIDRRATGPPAVELAVPQ